VWIQTTIYKYAESSQATGSILYGKKTHWRQTSSRSISDNCGSQTLWQETVKKELLMWELVPSWCAWWRNTPHTHSVSQWKFISHQWIYNLLEQQVLACKTSLFTHEVLLNEFKVGEWCATSATTFTKPTFITTNSHQCVTHILTPLFKLLSNYKNTYAFSSKTVQAMLCAV
jgi:hypothetical protein